MNRILTTASVAGIVGAGMIGLAVPAYADNPANPADAQFFRALDKAGIEFADPQEALAAARAVCDFLHDGHPLNATVRGVKNANPDLSLSNAAEFVSIAKSSYCAAPAQSDAPNGTANG